ncbi:lipoate-protein ligase A [Dorcoceras hygrometricum]|uniref:Lipoate-protein ligase A n=1 Tax=Dorcoceras hygrometricum TaxID=472368 RepID=A0A2Z6ZT15_9LAMI|nr:lipoate-protein ligase A [Dorcoceras hygrometricum]
MKDYIARSDFIHRTISAVGSHFQLRYSEPKAIQWPRGTKFEPSSRLLRKEELDEAICKSSAVSALLSL